MISKRICQGIIMLLFILIFSMVIINHREKIKLNDNLKERYDIILDQKYKIIINERNKLGWHGEQQKFTLIQLNKAEDMRELFERIGLVGNEMSWDHMKRIREIEDILNIEDENKVNFKKEYYYKICTSRIFTISSEPKMDFLYMIITNENNKIWIFLIEDIGVLDLEQRPQI